MDCGRSDVPGRYFLLFALALVDRPGSGELRGCWGDERTNVSVIGGEEVKPSKEVVCAGEEGTLSSRSWKTGEKRSVTRPRVVKMR